MACDQLPGERDAEPGAAFGSALAARLHPALRQRQLLSAHAAAIISDANFDIPPGVRIARAADLDHDPPAIRGAGNGIVEQIAHRPAELARIGRDHPAPAALQVKAEACRDDRRFALAHQRGEEVEHVQPFLADRQQPSFGLRQIEHVLDLLGQAFDRGEDRVDIFARRLRIGRRAALQQLGIAADRGERRAEFVAHIGEELGLDRIGFFQRLGAFAQGLLGLLRGGDVEHRQQPVAIGERYPGKAQCASVSQLHLPTLLAPVERRRAHRRADQRGFFGMDEIATDRTQQLVGARVAVEQVGGEAPGARKAAVPELLRAIGGEDRERFEQAVKRRGAGAQQRVVHGGEREAFSSVLGDKDKAAVGHRLGDDPQMRAAGQRPGFLARFAHPEPRLPLPPPLGKVAHFGGAATFARFGHEAIKRRARLDHLFAQRKQPPERTVGEGQALLGIEQRDADRELIEQRALGIAEGAELARDLLLLLDIDGIARDPLLPERQVRNAQGAPRAEDRGGDDPFRRVLALEAGARDIGGRAGAFRLEQLDLALHHLGRADRADGIDIGLVDELELQFGIAEPHRHWRGLDQADKRGEVPRGARGSSPEAGHLGMALAEIEHPHQRRPSGRDLRIGERAVEREGALRAGQVDRHAKGRGAFLGGLDLAPQLVDLRLRQPAGLGVAGRRGKFGEVFGHAGKAQHPGQPLGRLDPPVDPHQQRQGWRDVEQGLHPLDAGAQRLRAPRAAVRAQHDNARPHRPGGKNERNQHQREWREVHCSTAMRAALRVQRGTSRPPPTPCKNGAERAGVRHPSSGSGPA